MSLSQLGTDFCATPTLVCWVRLKPLLWASQPLPTDSQSEGRAPTSCQRGLSVPTYLARRSLCLSQSLLRVSRGGRRAGPALSSETPGK